LPRPDHVNATRKGWPRRGVFASKTWPSGVRDLEKSMGINGRDERIPEAGRKGAESGFLRVLRAAALVAVVAGGAGSLGLLLRAGRRTPRLLLLLFVLWVLSPFAALVWANLVSKHWSIVTRATLYSVMLILTVGSLAVYGVVVLGSPRAKPAAVFLLVPLAAWLVTAIAVSMAALRSRRLSR